MLQQPQQQSCGRTSSNSVHHTHTTDRQLCHICLNPYVLPYLIAQCPHLISPVCSMSTTCLLHVRPALVWSSFCSLAGPWLEAISYGYSRQSAISPRYPKCTGAWRSRSNRLGPATAATATGDCSRWPSCLTSRCLQHSSTRFVTVLSAGEQPLGGQPSRLPALRVLIGPVLYALVLDGAAARLVVLAACRY